MENLITVKNVKGYVDEKGTAYLNLEDVARGLGFTRIANSGNEVIRWERVRKYLQELNVPTNGHDIVISCDGQGKENLPEFIPENIFYKLCMKANNETARAFQDLVCDEILPTIRKTGGYMTISDSDTEMDIMAKAVLLAQKSIEMKNKKIAELETKIDSDAQRVSFAETIEKSSDCLLVREFSKVIANEGINLGEKKLYRWLRDKGFILKNSTEPTQRAVTMGLFKVAERVVKAVTKDIVTKTTRITGKGQIYFLELLKKEFLA